MSNGFGWAGNRTLNGLFEFGFIYAWEINVNIIKAHTGKFCPLLEVLDTACTNLFLKDDGDARTETFYHSDGVTEFFQLDAHPAVQKCMWFQATTQNILLEYRLLDNVMNFTNNGIIRSSGGAIPTAAGDVLTWTGGVYPTGQMEWVANASSTHIVGEVFLWSTSVPPTAPGGQEYRICEGQSLLRANYTELTTLFSASVPAFPYGAVDPLHLTLPDLTDCFPIYKGYTSTGLIGETGGENLVLLAENQLPPHDHPLNSIAPGQAVIFPGGLHKHYIVYDSGGNHNAPVLNLFGAGCQGGIGNYAMNLGDVPQTDDAGSHTHILSGLTELAPVYTAPAVQLKVDLKNKYLNMMYIIRVK